MNPTRFALTGTLFVGLAIGFVVARLGENAIAQEGSRQIESRTLPVPADISDVMRESLLQPPLIVSLRRTYDVAVAQKSLYANQWAQSAGG